MASESTSTFFSEHQAPWEKDEERSVASVTLNGGSVGSLPLSDEFPEGGLTAWTTAFGV